MIAEASSLRIWPSWAESRPVSCEASWEALVLIGSIHFSRRAMNSASISSHTSIAHWMTCRITQPLVLAKSGSM
jgi:hypothetical protein